MAELWYYTNEGVQMDAVTIKELRRLVGEGVLKPTDMVWQEGMPRWIRASSVTELFPDPAAALDHYFTHTAGKTAPADLQSPSTSVKAAGQPATPSSNGASPAEAKGQPKKSSDDEAERRKPPRRRTEAPTASGGMSWGIIIAIFIGAGVLLAGLVVGVVILIVVTRHGDAGNDRKDGIVQVNKDAPKADDRKINPGIDKVNPGNNVPKIVGQTNYGFSLAPNQSNSREFSFETGATYEIVVKSTPRHPDVDLFIISPVTNFAEISDKSIGPDSFIRWTPNRTGPYRIEVRNLNDATRVTSTVTIREVAPPPNRDKKEEKPEPKLEPLPPDTFEKSGLQTTIVAAGKEAAFKFRVRAGYKASFSATSRLKGSTARLNLIVVKENDNAVILAEEKDARPNPRVQLELPNTEIVRVRIINNGKSTTSVNLLYDVSP